MQSQVQYGVIVSNTEMVYENNMWEGNNIKLFLLDMLDSFSIYEQYTKSTSTRPIYSATNP